MAAHPIKIRPEDYIEEFLPRINRPVVPKNRWHVIPGPKIELRHLQAELHETEQRLKKKREEQKQKRKEFAEQLEDIAFEGRHLKENFVTFSQFIQENVHKRKRAIETRDQLKKVIKEREDGVRDFQEKIENLQLAKVELEEELSKHEVFEEFLLIFFEKYEKHERFANIFSIMERYQYYIELNKFLQEKRRGDFENLQDALIELDKYKEQSEHILMSLHTRNIGLYGRYENVLRRVRQMEMFVARVREHTLKKYADVKTTQNSIWNLYKIICRRQNVPSRIGKDNIERQLLFIKKNLLTFKKINALRS